MIYCPSNLNRARDRVESAGVGFIIVKTKKQSASVTYSNDIVNSCPRAQPITIHNP